MGFQQPTAPCAFDYMFNLITEAASASGVTVIRAMPISYVPGAYIVLSGFSGHRFVPESVPLSRFKETYNIVGSSFALLTDEDWQDAQDQAWSNYWDYVVTQVSADGNRLGNNVSWTVPASANGVNSITDIGGALHTVSFEFECVSLAVSL